MIVVSTLFNVVALADVAISVYQDEHTLSMCGSQEFEYQNIKLMKLAKQSSSHSDHELMVISSSQFGTILSYNIGEQYWGSDGKFINNGFGIKQESDDEYRERLLRIFARIRQAQQETNADIILLQEYMEPWQEIIDAPRLAEIFEGFTYTRASKNVTLVKQSLNPTTINLRLSFTSKNSNRIIATVVKGGVVINQHSAWQSKEAERSKSDVINDLNAVLAHVGAELNSVENIPVLIAGDWNREDYDLVDEQRTMSIDDFAKQLKLKDMQLAKPGVYTNLRYLKNSTGELTTSVLTTSDYAVEGMLRGDI